MDQHPQRSVATVGAIQFSREIEVDDENPDLCLRFSFRQLLKTRGMTVLAILTLALGICANTAIFTVIEDVIGTSIRQRA